MSADSLEAAVALAKGCPVLEIGGAVDVYEAIAMYQAHGGAGSASTSGPEPDPVPLVIDQHERTPLLRSSATGPPPSVVRACQPAAGNAWRRLGRQNISSEQSTNFVDAKSAP